jgi:8-amino-3,8-dideoxy-alpha-D-manno-octulosonate transaminase
MGNLPQELKTQMQDLNSADFSKSDAWMSRTISSLVKIGWTEKEVVQRAITMSEAIKSVLSL